MTQPTSIATDNYPLCGTCCAAIVNADMSAFAFDPLIESMVAEFTESAGMLVHTGTNPVPETAYDWQCAACGELCTGDAEWFTTL